MLERYYFAFAACVKYFVDEGVLKLIESEQPSSRMTIRMV
jgi:hypothetical protein